MAKFVALLRGINVGGYNKLPMADLRRVAAGLGWRNTRTYIASGNLVFEAEAGDHATTLRQALVETTGLDAPVMVLGEDRFRALLTECPFDTSIGKAVHVWVGEARFVANSKAMEALRSPTENFSINGLSAYLHAPEGIARSKLAAAMERHLGQTATARNLNTVIKVIEMLDA